MPHLLRSWRTITHTSRVRVSESPGPLRPMWTAFPSSLAGRYSGDYYGASVAIGLASRRRSHVRLCLYVLARLRRPTHLLECPRWTSLRTPEVHRATMKPRAECGAGFSRLSGGWELASSGDWASNNPVFAISRGPPGTPSLTTEPGHWFSDMLLSPSPFGSR